MSPSMPGDLAMSFIAMQILSALRGRGSPNQHRRRIFRAVPVLLLAQVPAIDC